MSSPDQIKELRKAFEAARDAYDVAYDAYDTYDTYVASREQLDAAYDTVFAAYHAATIDAFYAAKAALEAAEKEMTDEQS